MKFASGSKHVNYLEGAEIGPNKTYILDVASYGVTVPFWPKEKMIAWQARLHKSLQVSQIIFAIFILLYMKKLAQKRKSNFFPKQL